MLLPGQILESFYHKLINPALCCPALMMYLRQLPSRLRQPPEEQRQVLKCSDKTTNY